VNFRRWVVFTFLVHVLVVAIDKGGGLVLYLLTADQPKWHGAAGIVASLPFILGAIANLGLASALVFLVRRGRCGAQVAFETSMAVALVWGGFLALLATAVVLWGLPAIDPSWTVSPWLAVPFCAVVPLLLVASYANSTQLATDRVRDYGIVHVVTSLTFLPAFFLIFYGCGGRVEQGHVTLGVAWGRLISTAIVVAVTLWMVRKVVALRVRVHREFLGEAIRYGWKANLTSTLTYLNQRIGMVVLFAILYEHHRRGGADDPGAEGSANTQVAFYSMAITWAELVWHFPEAMRDLFFSKVAGSTHAQARELTPVLSRIGLTISVAGALVIVFLVDPAMAGVTWVAKGTSVKWYAEWSPSVTASLWMLVPGTAAYTVSKVLQADLAARDRLQTCVHAQLLLLVVLLVSNVVLVPEHGAVGAALASTIAYVVSTGYTLVAYARQTGTPMHRCLIVQPCDFRYLREIGAAVAAKLWRRR
jgi:O-antigen/teichoic acid export membrane protein